MQNILIIYFCNLTHPWRHEYTIPDCEFPRLWKRRVLGTNCLLAASFNSTVWRQHSYTRWQSDRRTNRQRKDRLNINDNKNNSGVRQSRRRLPQRRTPRSGEAGQHRGQPVGWDPPASAPEAPLPHPPCPLHTHIVFCFLLGAKRPLQVTLAVHNCANSEGL